MITGTRLRLVAELHNCTHKIAEKARAKKILVWVQITSHFTSLIKASAYKKKKKAYIIYNAQSF